MNRARFAVAATLLSTTLYAGAADAGQAATTTSQPLQSVLAGKKLTPPIKGEAVVEFTPAVVKREKDIVVTTMKVRNASAAPIARLKVTETWFDKDNQIVGGGAGVINGLLQPGEVQTIKIESPYNAKFNGNGFNFTHANGTVKPTKVKTLDDPKAATTPAGKAATTAKTGKEPAAKPATAKK